MNTLQQQYDIVNMWGLASKRRLLNDRSQCVYLHADKSKTDKAIATVYKTNKTAQTHGEMHRHQFEQITLSTLCCQFHRPEYFTNSNHHAHVTLYFILDGYFEFGCSRYQPHQALAANARSSSPFVTVTAPSIFLFKGHLGSVYAKMPAHTLIHAISIELAEPFVDILCQQRRHKSGFVGSVLHKLSELRQDHAQFVHLSIDGSLADIAKLAWQIVYASRADDELSLLALHSQTLNLVTELFAHTPNAHICTKEQHITHAKLLLQPLHVPRLTIRQLARRVGMNECDLKRQFKQVTGMTIGQYRHKQLMTYLEEQHSKGVGFTELAQNLGYSSGHYLQQMYLKQAQK